MSIKNFLHRITASRPMRLIEINGEPYLERYYIGRAFGREIWLHRFVRDDAERHVHDHPWSALSIILSGEYHEAVAVPGGFQYEILRAPAVNHIPAHKRHRIVGVAPGTWSLMIVGKRTGRGWFFYGADGSKTAGPSGGDDWHKTAQIRSCVYALREIMREADACAHEPDRRVPPCRGYDSEGGDHE